MLSDVRKPFMLLGEEPVLQVTLERFLPVEDVVEVILAVNPADFERKDEILFQTASLGVTKIVSGGATRGRTVQNALAALSDDVEIVLIHDAVRPFVSRRVIEGVIEAAGRSGAAIAAVGVVDTLKKSAAGAVVETVDRSGFYRAQTPQGFKRGVIEEAYAAAGGREFTDDASLVESMGGRVEIVESGVLNIKITTPEDMELAGVILKAVRDGRIHF
jgi:2-C-methyl-D-erythritol 4-phosphate cytidylyltransferase